MLGLTYQNFWKRAIDLLAAIMLLAALLPFLLIVAVLIRTKLGSPIFFHQDRLGLNGKSFRIWKFRTMTDARGEDGELLPDEQRLTSFGQFLRSWSIDELPQLLNILNGEMSLLGPRPLISEYAEHYTEQQMRRHEVRPGISGWAQVKGRNSLSWDEKFDLDVWYVDNQSFLLDLKILLLTIKNVIVNS
mgnify:FL=1